MTIKLWASILRPFINFLVKLTPLFDLLSRAWVSYTFLLAGLSKIHNWNSTTLLFTYEYHVPLLPPYLAAILGTIAELVLPILLVLGLGGRIVIFIFFVYNLIAMISYPFLWTPNGQVGLYQHISWGLLLSMLMCHGPGKLSLDYLIKKKHGHHLLRGKSAIT
jgi:putative oxidoreductase